MTYVVIFSDRKGWSRNMSVINLHWSKFRVHITDNLNDSVSHYWFWVEHPSSTRSLRWGSVCLPRNMSVNNLQWSEICGHITESGVFLLGFHGFELGVLGHFTDICETRLTKRHHPTLLVSLNLHWIFESDIDSQWLFYRVIRLILFGLLLPLVP